MIRYGIALLSIILLSGCINTLRVYEGDTTCVKKIKGIPFFTKTAIYRQTTVYQRYQLKLLLTRNVLDNNDKPTNTKVYAKTIGSIGHQKLNELEKKLVAAHSGLHDVTDKDVVDLFESIEPATESDYIQDVVPILNTVEQIVIVDYSRTYYLNAPLPWFGNGSVNGELNADGTLSKGSSNVTTGLADILKDVLPVKEFLSAKLQLTSKGIKAAALVTRIEIKLSIEKIGNIYEFTAIHKNDPRLEDPTCPRKSQCKLPLIDFVLKDRQYTTRPIGSSKSLDESKSKIKFDGSVVVPEK